MKGGTFLTPPAPENRQGEHGSPASSGQEDDRQLNNGPIRNRPYNNKHVTASYPIEYHRVRRLASHPDLVDTELGIYAYDPAFAKYAACVADPWGAEPARVPTGSQLPSQVYKATTVLTVSTGTNGFGFVAISPTTANGNTAAYYSGPTFAGTEIPSPIGPYPAGVSAATMSQLPYDMAAHAYPAASGNATSVASRLVAASAEIIPTTAEINRGGQIRAGQRQLGVASGVDFAQQQDTIVGNAWDYDGASPGAVQLRWQTSSVNDLDFNTYFGAPSLKVQPFSSCFGGDITVAGSGTPTMYFIMQAPANPAGGYFVQTYRISICYVVEYTGFVAAGVPISTSGVRRALPGAFDVRRTMVEVLNRTERKRDKASWWDRITDNGFVEGASDAFHAATRNAKEVFEAIAPLLGASRGARPTPTPAPHKQLPAPNRRVPSTVTIEELPDRQFAIEARRRGLAIKPKRH